MSIKSELSVLKVNIQNAKNKLYTNLVDKGVTDITTASTLDVMADSVSDIVTGGGGSSEGGNPFEAIGYSEIPQYIQDGIDYSKTIYDNWDASITSCINKYKEDKQLVYFPLVDTSNVTTMRSMFSGCINLQNVPQINTSNVTDMGYMFGYCGKLTSLDVSLFNTSKVTDMKSMFISCGGLTSLDVSKFDTSNVTEMSNMFNYCSGLTSLDVSSFDTSNVTNMSYMFNQCNNLTSLDVSSFDTSNVTDMSNMFGYCSKLQAIYGYLDWSKISSYPNNFYNDFSFTLRKFTIKNLGKTGTTFNFSGIYLQNWGNEKDTTTYPLSVGARQSLVDSLLTYSYDRASNGLSTCTIQLQSNVKARLTSDEIAQITAKGFTIA